ncbi:hypothetical protein NCC78_29465 [Micromonospora phytophila]|uniref:hypothetical protein n=1 Tax=Micromonospora phytophila TaxID=709888 RepID=UPI00202E4C08|nr:hypothetical protein [Micromonospora phytophila]MCM0678773.1 hypothetical protein [Micromonospora phytophila]
MTREHRRRAFERMTALQVLALFWAPLTLLVGVPVRWLLERGEPLAELVLGGAQNVLWVGPALYLGRRVEQTRAAGRDPEAYGLRQAVRTGVVPADDAVRAELPAYLAAQRRGTVAALAVVLAGCLGLVLLGWLVVGNEGWAVIYGAAGVVSAAVAALTLSRLRRLDRRLAGSGQGG